ncbi:MAG: GGDEF domain-containing protein, partial [Mycobacteriales bacterium]
MAQRHDQPADPVSIQLPDDPVLAIRAVDDLGLAAIHISADGVVSAGNGSWQRAAATGGLFAALRDGRDLVDAAAAAGISPALLADLLATAMDGGTGQVEVSVPGPLGTAPRVYRLHSRAAGRAAGGVILTCVDVTVPTGVEQRLQHESMHDRLTGLAHRDALLSEIATALASEGDRRHLVLYVDLDGLKQINDAHGHAVGDALLIEVGRRLSGDVSNGDVVARLGGDEFALLCRDVAGVEAALARAQQIRHLLTIPYEVAGRRLTVTATLGCRVSGLREYETAENMLGEATEAMYQAKRIGRDGLALYSAEQHERSVRRTDVEWALTAALAAKQFELVYQPQVST